MQLSNWSLGAPSEAWRTQTPVVNINHLRLAILRTSCQNEVIMTIACVIPARFHSSRFPGKLLKMAAGKTVLQHTFEKASQCKDIDALFVATDHEQIADHIQGLGGEIIWTSPECQNGTERICEAMQKDARLQKASYIVNLQGDHPCTKPETISAIVQALKSDKTARMSTAVTKIQDPQDFFSPHIVKCVFDLSLNALYFSRAPIPFNGLANAYAHIGIYCYQPKFLKEIFAKESTPHQKCEDLEQLKVLENGHRVKIAVVEETILGIDTPKDLETLKEFFLCQSNISS